MKGATKVAALGGVVTTGSILRQIEEWAHEASKESLAKIMDVLIREETQEIRERVERIYECAQEEYYRPKNKKEEAELLLAKCIHAKQEQLWNKEEEIAELNTQVEEHRLEGRVHDRILKTGEGKEFVHGWNQMFFSDRVDRDQDKLLNAEQHRAYLSIWLREARAMVIVERYKHIPYAVIKRLCGEEVFELEEFDGDEY